MHLISYTKLTYLEVVRINIVNQNLEGKFNIIVVDQAISSSSEKLILW